jgi:hypothetical protein
MATPELVRLFVLPLEALGLPYMVTGSVASTFYGEPRLTYDVDLVLDLRPSQIAQVVNAFRPPDYYCPPEDVLRVEAARPSHGHFNLLHAKSGLKADVYLAGDDPLHQWAFQLRRKVRIDGGEIWVAPPEYVIVRKLLYFREGGSDKHLRDIQRMLAAGAVISHDEIEKRCRSLGLSEFWDRVRKP